MGVPYTVAFPAVEPPSAAGISKQAQSWRGIPPAASRTSAALTPLCPSRSNPRACRGAFYSPLPEGCSSSAGCSSSGSWMACTLLQG